MRPLLTWDPITDAPAGFVGDGATPHVVTGSPCLTNFFGIEGPDGIDVRTNYFVVQGKPSTNFGLAVDRATYTRDGTGAGSIDVFASSVPEQTLVVDDGIGLTAMTGDGTGKYFASIPFATLPAGITEANVTDDPDTVLTPALIDLVTINSAEYNNASTLTVSAVSSDAGGSDTEPGVVAVAPTAADVCVIAVTPTSIDFLLVNVGTTSTLRVIISNANGTVDCVIDLTLNSPTGEFALNPASPTPIFTVAASDPLSKDVLVDYTPSGLGLAERILDIVSFESDLVSVPLSGTGSVAEIITVQRAQFRTAQNEWCIDGTTTVYGPGNIIHIHLGDTFGTELGDAEVDNVGAWSFR